MVMLELLFRDMDMHDGKGHEGQGKVWLLVEANRQGRGFQGVPQHR